MSIEPWQYEILKIHIIKYICTQLISYLNKNWYSS